MNTLELSAAILLGMIDRQTDRRLVKRQTGVVSMTERLLVKKISE